MNTAAGQQTITLDLEADGCDLDLDSVSSDCFVIEESAIIVDVQSDSETIPDVVLRYNGNAGGLGWSLAGIGRQLSYDERANNGNTQVDDDTEFGYGLSFAGKWMFGRNDLRFMANYGNALGRYMGLNAFNDGYIDEDGKIKTFTPVRWLYRLSPILERSLAQHLLDLRSRG